MIYNVRYRREPRNLPPGTHYHEPEQTTTWCVPSGWSKQCVIDNFHLQFPGSTVISLEPKVLEAVE